MASVEKATLSNGYKYTLFDSRFTVQPFMPVLGILTFDSFLNLNGTGQFQCKHLTSQTDRQ